MCNNRIENYVNKTGQDPLTLNFSSVNQPVGDVFNTALSWNHGYFEINSTNENQLVAGDYNKNGPFSGDALLTRI